MKLKLTPRKTISLFVVGILLCSLGSYALGQSATSRNLYLNDLPHAVYYTLTNDGTYYWATRYDGGTYYYSTNASYTYNEAASDLTHTYKQTILITGPAWTITAPLLIYSYETLQIDTDITLAGGSNCNMIQCANPASYTINVKICGSGSLDGNDAGNSASGTSGNGIYFVQGAEIPSLTDRLLITDLKIKNCEASCIYLDASGGGSEASYFWLENLVLEGGDEKGLYITDAYDVHVSSCHIGGDLTGLGLNSVGSFYGEHLYVNQGIDITALTWGVLDDFRVDIGTARNGINLNATQLLTVSNGNINVYGSYGSSAYAILLGSYGGTHSKSNVFSNIVLAQWTAGVTDSFDNGICEASSSQDYNLYSNINGQYCTNYAVKTLGSHSHGGIIQNASTYVAAF